MDPTRPGFLRIGVLLHEHRPWTPGEVAQACGIDLDHVGPILIDNGEAFVEVAIPVWRQARAQLDRIGRTKIMDWRWLWLKLNVGRNHGVTLGQLKKIMAAAEGLPLGKITLNNTHSAVGIQEYRMPTVLAKLAGVRVNGVLLRPVEVPESEWRILGSPVFMPENPLPR